MALNRNWNLLSARRVPRYKYIKYSNWIPILLWFWMALDCEWLKEWKLFLILLLLYDEERLKQKILTYHMLLSSRSCQSKLLLLLFYSWWSRDKMYRLMKYLHVFNLRKIYSHRIFFSFLCFCFSLFLFFFLFVNHRPESNIHCHTNPHKLAIFHHRTNESTTIRRNTLKLMHSS